MASTCLRKDFFARLRRSSRPVLLLDYDGTLAPFSIERQEAKPYPEVIEALQALQQSTATRIVFVTGRTSSDLRNLLEPYKFHCEIWGVHGRQRLMPDGVETNFDLNEKQSAALQRAASLLNEQGFGDSLEVKTFSLAVHWRALDLVAQRNCRLAALRAFNFVHGKVNCRILEFDGGMELLTGKRDKGDAVREILKELPDQTPVAYLGDDVTDEDAFRALGDAGITILVREEYRPTAAEFWVKPPHELAAFFGRWKFACRGAI
jgi:trehalose 6-phosphate phosphatase